LVVTLKDSYGNRVPGVPVAFTDNGAGGTFNPPSPVTTNSSGTATVSYTLPTKAQQITITPSYGTLTGKFTEKAVAGSAASVSVISGNKQSGAPGTQLPKPLVAGVKDQYGNPVSGITVTFYDGGAGGTFSTTTPMTNNQGQASTTYTLPNTTGVVNVTATVGSFVASFTETAN
jgi:protocatechuate 3,4-dioxygenase beta subunit